MPEVSGRAWWWMFQLVPLFLLCLRYCVWREFSALPLFFLSMLARRFSRISRTERATKHVEPLFIVNEHVATLTHCKNHHIHLVMFVVTLLRNRWMGGAAKSQHYFHMFFEVLTSYSPPSPRQPLHLRGIFTVVFFESATLHQISVDVKMGANVSVSLL